MINQILLGDCFDVLSNVESNSVDLILTDPPYDISRKSYFGSGSNTNKKFKDISIDFGYWDKDIDMDRLFSEFYRVLRKGGTVIIFYDIWKSNIIYDASKKNKFKQPRVCQWIKNNAVPINSKVNYLSNSTEYFFSFVKGKLPTFNSEYDNATYYFPLCHGRERLNHPTQKPLKLISELVKKHSNQGDLVLDPFSGTGTLAESCILNGRNYLCIEMDEIYHRISIERINSILGI